ncbi:MAG: DNA polymerase II [Euryarchaeota archaeon]|nr:DNA polymerase II [Euryarchaeota archaeon]
MNLNFWILDIAHEVKKEKPQILLWCIDSNNKKVLVIDDTFLPYFYVLPKEKVDIKSLTSKILALSTNITNIELADRKLFGKPVKVLKITFRDPGQAIKLQKIISKLEEIQECYEYDVRYPLRYLIDNQLTPCGWHQTEVEEIKSKNYKVDAIYQVKKTPKPIEEAKIPRLKVLAFDIKCYSKRGLSTKTAADPVITISTATNNGLEKQFIATDYNDKKAIQGFAKFVQEFDPDCIVGYESNIFDWLYLGQRAKNLKIKLDVGRPGEPHTSMYGHVSIAGRANIDLYDFAEDIVDIKVKTLENIAEFLGTKIKPLKVDETKIPELWDDKKLREKLLEQSKNEVKTIIEVSEKLLPFAIQLSNVVGLPLDHVGAAAMGFRVEWYLIRQASLEGELIPSRFEKQYFPYRGAIVLAPKPGIHENVAVVDFSSMYPALMIQKNISPDTFVSEDVGVKSTEVNIAPEVGYKFRKVPDGFYKRVLSDLIKVRRKIKTQLKKLDPKSIEYRILDARQQAIKTTTNAVYGYNAWLGAKFYFKQVGEATAAWGRETITKTIEVAKKLGLQIIYADTDSLFIKYEKPKVEKLIETVREKLELEIELKDIYERIFFTEAKKKYAGLLKDGRIDITGFEVVRGDWAEIAREVQEKVFEIILKEKTPEKAVVYVQEIIQKMQANQIPYEELIIWKTLTKSPEEYEIAAPHVSAAKILLKAGGRLDAGDKIGFVITKGAGRLTDRAKPYSMAKLEDIDTDYYVNNQIIPPAHRILESFGVTEDQFKMVKKQKTLFEFK